MAARAVREVARVHRERAVAQVRDAVALGAQLGGVLLHPVLGRVARALRAVDVALGRVLERVQRGGAARAVARGQGVVERVQVDDVCVGVRARALAHARALDEARVAERLRLRALHCFFGVRML